MNPDFPPIELQRIPVTRKRRRERPQFFTLTPEEVNARRGAVAQIIQQAQKLSQTMGGMTDAQRKAIFVRLEHGPGIKPEDFVGTDLKVISALDPKITLAIPKAASLAKLTNQLVDFTLSSSSGAPIPVNPLGQRLEGIFNGDPLDRLSPYLREHYQEIVQKDFFKYELEIFSLEQGSKKRRSDLNTKLSQIESALGRDIGGRIYEHDVQGPTARAVLWSTGDRFRHLVEDPKWQTVIVRFEERPQFETFVGTFDNFQFEQLGQITPPPENAPVVCVIDTGVSPGNPFLAKVVKTASIKSYVPEKLGNPYDENGHGSGVASLVSYYALNLTRGATNAGKIWIASARVLNESGQLDSFESDDDETHLQRSGRLLSNVLREVVVDFKAQGAKIFVLSYNIINRLWNDSGRMTVSRSSWVSRTIDRLSREFDVLFVLITGNIPTYELKELMSHGYPEFFSREGTRLQDPGPAALAVTVGSIAHSTLVTLTMGTAIAPELSPSPFTRTGPGINNSIKPDFVELGGNSVQDLAGNVFANPGTNVMMASHQISPAIQHDCGTSYAAPRIAHHLALIQSDLQQLGPEPSANLLRAFLANSTTLEQTEARRAELGPKWHTIIGLGQPSSARATGCDLSSIVLFHDGTIAPDTVALFSIPVPAGLSQVSGRKRLSVTVSFAPKVQQWGLQEYFCMRAKFRVFSGSISSAVVLDRMTINEGEENEPTDANADGELKGTLGILLRSRGTLQHDVFEWSHHSEDLSQHHFTVAVAATKASWGKAGEPVPLAVVVRLEDCTATYTQLYSEVRAASQARATA